jgi:fatty acid desaturase
MFCSRSVSVHLARGAGAVILVALATAFGAGHVWLVPPLVIGAVVLMRGCPACWLTGLFETIALRAAARNQNGKTEVCGTRVSKPSPTLGPVR